MVAWLCVVGGECASSVACWWWAVCFVFSCCVCCVVGLCVCCFLCVCLVVCLCVCVLLLCGRVAFVFASVGVGAREENGGCSRGNEVV